MIKRAWQTLWRVTIRIFAFISKEVRAILHQPRLVFSLILGPFFILLIFGLGYRNTSRTLNTLFVVPQGSKIEALVEQYAQGLGSRIVFAGITDDADEADRRLRSNEVDLVVVTPPDPSADWENDQQSTLSLFHFEIDPVEETYVQVLGQRYAEEINRQLLQSAVTDSQQKAESWQEEVGQAREKAGLVRQALAAGDQARAQSSAEELKQDVDLLTLAVGSGLALAGGMEEATGPDGAASEMLGQLETLQSSTDQVVESAKADSTLEESEQSVAEVESSLEEMDIMLSEFRGAETSVLVAPFRSEAISITRIPIEPMNFYVPAVIALLLQHLAITLSGLSIIREKLGGAMEMFRAAPVTAFEMLLGKYASYVLLVGVIFAILTALVVFGLRVPQLGGWTGYVLILFALMLASLGVGFHISLSARSDSQAIQFGMLTLLAAIFFSGFFLPLYRLAPAARIISWMLPATYGTVLLQDVMLRGQPPQMILLLALFVMAIILFLLAWWRLARQMKAES